MIEEKQLEETTECNAWEKSANALRISSYNFRNTQERPKIVLNIRITRFNSQFPHRSDISRHFSTSEVSQCLQPPSQCVAAFGKRADQKFTVEVRKSQVQRWHTTQYLNRAGVSQSKTDPKRTPLPDYDARCSPTGELSPALSLRGTFCAAGFFLSAYFFLYAFYFEFLLVIIESFRSLTFAKQ
jgi:hypothetical protein